MAENKETNQTTQIDNTEAPDLQHAHSRALYTGRRVIYTDEHAITVNNVSKVLMDAMMIHEVNRIEMRELRMYEKGDQPVFYRVKTIRPEINYHANANYAKMITDFKVSYEFANPIVMVQRARDDWNKADPKQDDKRIGILNEMFFEQDKPSKDLQLAQDFKTVGVGYMMVLPKKYQGDDLAPFDILVLNPMNTFIIRSNDAYRRKLAAVTFNVNLTTETREYTVYTEDRIFVGKSIGDEYSGFTETPNPLHMIPIVEFQNNFDRQSCFEAVIPLMDALNILNSDRVNDVAGYVQSILWLNNCKMSEDQTAELRNGGFILTKTTADGREPKVTYVTSPLDQASVQTSAAFLFTQILQIAGMPSQETASGGNTGSAILLSNGWQIAETQAKAMERIFGDAENELIRIALRIIKLAPKIPDEFLSLKDLKPSDILVHFSRNRGYDLVSKTSALSNMIRLGIDPEKAISAVDIFDDAQQTAIDSLARIDKILFAQQNQQTDTKSLNSTASGTTVDGARSGEDFEALKNKNEYKRSDADNQKHNSGVS